MLERSSSRRSWTVEGDGGKRPRIVSGDHGKFFKVLDHVVGEFLALMLLCLSDADLVVSLQSIPLLRCFSRLCSECHKPAGFEGRRVRPVARLVNRL